MGVYFSCFKKIQEIDDVSRSGGSSLSVESRTLAAEPMPSEEVFLQRIFLTRSSLYDFFKENDIPMFDQQAVEEVEGSSQLSFEQSSIRQYSRINSRTISSQQANLQIDLERDLNPPISESEYIGGGAFGEVYKTNYLGRPAAVKLFYERHQQSVNGQDDQFTKELEIFCRLEHTNIVEFFGASRFSFQKAIVMEFVESSLYKYIRKPRDGPIPLIVILKIIKDIAKALHYLHQKFAHADLHSENVLIGPDEVPKIVDFNLSKLIQHNSEDLIEHGAPGYAAPELFIDNRICKRSDIYSLGMLAWEMWTKQCPWTGYGYFAIIENVMAGNRPHIPQNMPTILQSLIFKCWQQDKFKRPTAIQLYFYCKRAIKQIERKQKIWEVMQAFKNKITLKN
eukprot:TRINITY_DN1098_c0_g2_i1.p1 TRINITY_DN1098_c0_g2~~TRINITY_DN1098_c0_g2_i1.p1  ORF type:complete len:395 (+),score=42.71 TRINITY_DN1098_c0_g2_i1:175-1359(+)